MDTVHTYVVGKKDSISKVLDFPDFQLRYCEESILLVNERVLSVFDTDIVTRFIYN
jgi:hypothetical protein